MKIISNLKKISLVVLFALVSVIMFGCDFNFKYEIEYGEEKQISGRVLYNNVGLDNVKIRSLAKVFATTNDDGEFSFTTKQENVEIFAELDGYSFTGKFVLTESKNDVLFTASIVSNLSGEISLKKVYIYPTSIVEVQTNDFGYDIGSKTALKINNITLKIQDEEIKSLADNTYVYANKKEQKEIEVNSVQKINISPDSHTEIRVKTDAYFKFNEQEALATENNWTVVLNQIIDSTMLDDENTIKLTYQGINSSSNGFSYNIILVFDYYEDA